MIGLRTITTESGKKVNLVSMIDSMLDPEECDSPLVPIVPWYRKGELFMRFSEVKQVILPERHHKTFPCSSEWYKIDKVNLFDKSYLVLFNYLDNRNIVDTKKMIIEILEQLESEDHVPMFPLIAKKGHKFLTPELWVRTIAQVLAEFKGSTVPREVRILGATIEDKVILKSAYT